MRRICVLVAVGAVFAALGTASAWAQTPPDDAEMQREIDRCMEVAIHWTSRRALSTMVGVAGDALTQFFQVGVEWLGGSSYLRCCGRSFQW